MSNILNIRNSSCYLNDKRIFIHIWRILRYICIVFAFRKRMANFGGGDAYRREADEEGEKRVCRENIKMR